MFNSDRIWQHRGLLLTALKFYAKGVEKIIKGETEIEADTHDTERKLEIVELLRAELADPDSQLRLEGTPMGDVIGEMTLKDEDGSVLTADSVEAMLRRVGIDAPFDHVTAWTLDQRKMINAYRKAREQFLLGEAPEPTLPDIISSEWVKNDVLERDLTDEEVDTLIEQGPWNVRTDPNAATPGEAEWEIIRPAVPGDDADEKSDDFDGTIIWAERYGMLDRARLIAANMNIIERGKQARADEAEAGAGEKVEPESLGAAEDAVSQDEAKAEPPADDISKRRGKKKS